MPSSSDEPNNVEEVGDSMSVQTEVLTIVIDPKSLMENQGASDVWI